MIKANIFFTGMVQGVGFRYTTQRLASKIGLKGWVKNLVDGRVEIMVEGEKGEIEQLCQNLTHHFGSYIQHCDVAYSKHLNEFTDFHIQH